MADKAISDLTQALQITNEDLFVLEQSGEAKKLKGSQVVQYAKDSVAAEVQGVKEYADSAKASADAAAKDATRAETAAQGIDDKVAAADASAKAAASSAAAAAASATGVDEKVQAAQTAATNAAKSETAAKDAQTGAANAQKAAETAQTGAQTAKTAAESAQEAAESAKDAAAGSSTAAGQKATQAAQSAEDAASAKSAAETAKTDAQAARDSIVNMIVEAVTLASGSDATVSKSVVDNVFKLAFGIPRGNPGADAPTITGITIRQSDYHMIVSLSDGTTYDAGYCRGAAGAGSGDMMAAVYDPQGKQLDIYKYVDDAFSNVPATNVKFSDGTTFQQKLDSGALKGDPGKDGAPGAKGADGLPGKDGADGKTPVKGTDYFTPADVNEIAAEAAKKVDISGKLDKPANDATATVGQLLTKTADGQEWQDREKDVLNVILTDTGPTENPYVSNPAPDEILAAAQAGKVIKLRVQTEMYFLNYIYFDMETGEANLAFVRSDISVGKPMAGRFSLGRESQNTQWSWGYNMADTSMLLDSNGDSSYTTVNFTVASTRTALESGTKLAILMGKIAKWLNDLGRLAFKDTVTTNDVSAGIKASLGRADSALQSVSKSDVGLGNVANERQYSPANPPPYPVTSVNGKTGAVTVSVPTVPATTSLIKGNGSGGLAAATAGTDYALRPTTRKVTLTVSGWNSSTKQQTVTCSGVLSDATKQLLIPTPVNTAAGNPYDEASMQMVAQGANSVTFYADTVPTESIDVYVTIYPINYLG